MPRKASQSYANLPQIPLPLPACLVDLILQQASEAWVYEQIMRPVNSEAKPSLPFHLM